MDLVETEGEFVLRADLPGLAEDDVNIELEDNVLTISGERKSEHEERKRGLLPRRAQLRLLPSLADPARGRRRERDQGATSTTACSRSDVPKPEERKPQKVEITVGGAAPDDRGRSESGSRAA